LKSKIKAGRPRHLRGGSVWRLEAGFDAINLVVRDLICIFVSYQTKHF